MALLRLIICGSRGLGYDEVVLAIQAAAISPADVACVLSGGSRGVDQAGERWAAENCISVEQFPANWKTHGRGAPHRRNVELVKHGDMMLAVWDGVSHGTIGMVEAAISAGLEVFVWGRQHELCNKADEQVV